MNQILSTESNIKKENKVKNKNKKSSNENKHPDLLKKAVIVFSILLITFAMIILIVKLVNLGKNKAKTGKTGELNKPEISIEKVNDDKVNIKISYDENINKISWWWNDNISQIQERNYNVKFISIDVPEGENNILHIEVSAADGSTNNLEETLTRKVTTTIERKQIPETDNMEIIAKSKVGIEKIVYYWNDESPTTVLATEKKQKELSETIQLKRGRNKLHIIATDIEGNVTEKEELLQCVKDPEIDVQINLDQMIIIVTVEHDMGLKKVEVEANGKSVTYDENYERYDPDRKKITLKAKLKEGIDNTVKVEAYSNEKSGGDDDDTTTYAEYIGHKDLTDMVTEEE